jgi:hypothetical protein
MKVPTVEDFTWTPKPEDDLEGFWAWRNFGGLIVDEAYQKFCQFPESYQEDFMFMGDAAFTFYFPVVDRYIREKEPEYQDGKEYPFDGETHILAHCIGMHVSEKRPSVRPLYDQIVELCHFVLQSLENVTDDQRRSWSPEEIKRVWTELLDKTLFLMQGTC